VLAQHFQRRLRPRLHSSVHGGHGLAPHGCLGVDVDF
jgi:hypothetical protein